jgi:hypothetical protein
LEHIDEFVNASYDEHKSCLTKTLNKVMRVPFLSEQLLSSVCT